MGRLAQLAGDESSGGLSGTFVFQDEGYTLGNVLVSIISQYSDVEFCSYVVPHPAEAKMQIRIQMKPRTRRAVDVLRQGLIDLDTVCDHVTETFQNACETSGIGVE